MKIEILLIASVILISCNKDSNGVIEGTWRIDSVVDSGFDISLVFVPGSLYTYSGQSGDMINFGGDDKMTFSCADPKSYLDTANYKLNGYYIDLIPIDTLFITEQSSNRMAFYNWRWFLNSPQRVKISYYLSK